MFKKLKTAYRRLSMDEPGRRFIRSYERQRQFLQGVGPTVLVLAAATGLMIAGILLGLIPGVPGIVLGVFGAGLLATRFRFMAVILDRAEVWLRAIWKKWRPGPERARGSTRGTSRAAASD